MASNNEQFAQAASEWDLETLYADLASAKGKRLTPVEKLHLRGLLCGYSPAEIAERLNKSVKGLGVDLCQTLYHYVKNLVGRGDEKVENWRNITEWLQEAGYKTQSSTQCESSDCLPLEFLIKRANITIDKHKVIVDINLRIVASSPSEPPGIEDIDTNGKG
ncbi:MAG TPA: helix-turn-helix domain containing protein [Cyanobacteria bacterium UBA11372]|nr:helix-turn-helix domain containing protein [Cyanobacteria bacterium UBA11372]